MQITTQRGAFLTIFFLSLCSLQDNHHSSSAVYCREGGSGLPWWSPVQWLQSAACSVLRQCHGYVVDGGVSL